MSTTNPTPIILSGLPGRMAAEIAAASLEAPWPARLRIHDTGLTGPEGPTGFAFADRTIRLACPAERDGWDFPSAAIAVDFTEPAAALANVRFYASKGISFVLGTTGFDAEEAARIVGDAGICAVIAPNMATPIVMLQWAVAQLAERFPGALAGYGFSATESHQAGKKDTSGTAKALVRDFARMGLPASEEAIAKIREPEAQARDLGVPPEHIGGHAYHYYEIATPAGDVRIQLNHLVDGRRVYAVGALQAAEFLARRIASGARGAAYSMHDVLADMQGA